MASHKDAKDVKKIETPIPGDAVARKQIVVGKQPQTAVYTVRVYGFHIDEKQSFFGDRTTPEIEPRDIEYAVSHSTIGVCETRQVANLYAKKELLRLFKGLTDRTYLEFVAYRRLSSLPEYVNKYLETLKDTPPLDEAALKEAMKGSPEELAKWLMAKVPPSGIISKLKGGHHPLSLTVQIDKLALLRSA